MHSFFKKSVFSILTVLFAFSCKTYTVDEFKVVTSFGIYNSPSIEKQLSKYPSDVWEKNLNFVFKRASLYELTIKKVLREQGVPEELWLLPFIESEFLCTAVSPVGAVGLWQFMPDTGREKGLKINEWVDERRDFFKATEAAAKFLKSIHKSNGDWLLTLAAYNCGPNRIKQIVKKTGVHDFWTMAELGLLPKETADYVPKFLAIVYISQKYSTMGIMLENFERPQWSSIELKKALNLRLLSEQTGIPYEELKVWNSELKKEVTPLSFSNYRLKYPLNDKTKNLNEYIKENSDKLIKLSDYTVQKGDSYYSIAKKINVYYSMINEFNPTIKPEDLREGIMIKIPQE